MTVILVLIYLLTACKNEPPKANLEYEEYNQIKEYDTIFATGHSENQGAVYVITDEDSVALISLDKRFIYDISYKMHGRNYKGLQQQWGRRVELEECKICVYDMENMKIMYEYDIKSLLEPYWMEYQLVRNTLGTGIRKGKQVITLRLEKRPTDEEILSGVETEEVMFWLDFESGEMQLLKPEDKVTVIDYPQRSDKIWFLRGVIMFPLLSIEVDTYPWAKNTTYIKIETKYLPEHNKKLYEMFPDLETYKKEKEHYAYIFLSPQPDNLEALSLILDDYKDLDFSALETRSAGFYGYYRLNGERHYITKSDIDQFQKEYQDYRKKQREEYGIEESEFSFEDWKKD